MLPLTASAVAVDSVAAASLPAPEGDDPPGGAAVRVRREFHPVFGQAVATAARRVRVAVRDADAPGSAAADSVRYLLTVESLAITGVERAAPRRFVPPEPAGFDPATGRMTTGSRHGRTEGPGLATTVTARAVWSLRDLAADSLSLRGEAEAHVRFRREAGRDDWNRIARDLALDLLRRTPFAP